MKIFKDNKKAHKNLFERLRAEEAEYKKWDEKESSEKIPWGDNTSWCAEKGTEDGNQSRIIQGIWIIHIILGSC